MKSWEEEVREEEKNIKGKEGGGERGIEEERGMELG